MEIVIIRVGIISEYCVKWAMGRINRKVFGDVVGCEEILRWGNGIKFMYIMRDIPNSGCKKPVIFGPQAMNICITIMLI